MRSLSPRARRAILFSLGGLASLYLSYVLVVLAALEAGVLTRLTQATDDLKLEASGGHSLWPGHVVLKDAHLRFKDYNIEMSIEARELSLDFSPWSLLAKTIQVDEVRALDARYKMLHRVHDAQRNQQRLAAFPDIGFERSKVYDSPKPPYAVPPFRVRVSNIRANVLEAWILELRAVGNFQATGGFEVHENVTVFPSHADVRGAELFIAGQKVSSHTDCDLWARLSPFPGRAPVTRALAATDAQISCDVAIDDVSPFRMYWPDPELLLEGEAKLQANLKLVAGQLQSSSADARVHVRRVGFEGAFLAGQAHLSSTADAHGSIRLQGDFRGDETGPSSVALAELRGLAQLAGPQLLAPSLRTAKVHMLGLNVRDPRFARRLSDSEDVPLFKIEQANLELDYQAAASRKPGAFQLRAQGGAALFPKEDTSISCAYRARIECSLQTERALCPGSTLECSPLTVSTSPDKTGAIMAKLVADSLELAPERDSSAWVATLGNPKDLLRATAAENVWTQLGLSLAPLGEVEARIRVNRHQGTIAGTVDDASSGLISARAGFLLAESVVSRWRVTTPLGIFGVNQTQAGTTVTPFVARDWDIHLPSAR